MDSLGRPYVDTGNAGQKLSYGYDSNGKLTSVTDAANRTTSYTYDALDRKTKITGPDGGATLLEYDDQSFLKSVTDPRGLKTSYTYNAFGEVLTITSPDTGTTVNTYDAIGRLASTTPSDNKVTIYAWDQLGRLRSRSVGGSTDTFNYDEGAYGKGRLTRFQDRTGETRYTFSPAGELLWQTNVVFGKVFNTTWSYDAAGRLEGMSYPSGLMLKYVYDANRRLAAIKRSGSQ